MSLLLALSDYKISLYDVTEGYYLFQNLLFSSFDVNNELAEENSNFKDEKNKINHIPWWEFRNLNEKNIKFDIEYFKKRISPLLNDYEKEFVLFTFCFTHFSFFSKFY